MGVVVVEDSRKASRPCLTVNKENKIRPWAKKQERRESRCAGERRAPAAGLARGGLGRAAAAYTQLGRDGSEPSALTSARLGPAAAR